MANDRAWQKVNRRRWAAARRQTLDRDGWRCRRCGRAGRMEVDHIRPVQDGGDPYDLANLQTLCRSCHISKTRGENIDRLASHRPQAAAWRRLVDEML